MGGGGGGRRASDVLSIVEAEDDFERETSVRDGLGEEDGDTVGGRTGEGGRRDL